jgi:hypothetical protein
MPGTPCSWLAARYRRAKASRRDEVFAADFLLEVVHIHAQILISHRYPFARIRNTGSKYGGFRSRAARSAAVRCRRHLQQ